VQLGKTLMLYRQLEKFASSFSPSCLSFNLKIKKLPFSLRLKGNFFMLNERHGIGRMLADL
jgi:hypothetical protein